MLWKQTLLNFRVSCWKVTKIQANLLCQCKDRKSNFRNLSLPRDYNAVLSKCGVYSFRISSLKAMAVEIHKILNDERPEYLSLFSKASIPYSLRDNNKLIQQKMRMTTFGIKSLSYYGTHLWNSLPIVTKRAVTLTNFKTPVKNWQGLSCHGPMSVQNGFTLADGVFWCLSCVNIVVLLLHSFLVLRRNPQTSWRSINADGVCAHGPGG